MMMCNCRRVLFFGSALRHDAQLKDDPTMDPRNMKQFYNAAHIMKKEQFPEDQLALMDYHAMMFPKLMPDYRTIDGKKYALCVLPQMDAHLNAVLKSASQLVLNYDTTYDCGNFLVSILSFRHPWFEEEPIIPVSVLIHETRLEVGHRMMFENRRRSLRALNQDKSVIIVDREASCKSTLADVLPRL